MTEYTIPQSHKVLLQLILEELILSRDEDATFVEFEPPIEVKPVLDGFGRPIGVS